MNEREHISPSADMPPAPESPQQHQSFFKEIVKFSIIAFLIVVPVRVFIAQPFIVSGASMEPTFDSGEYLIVDQLSYQFDDPHRGDVIIFKFPEDESKFFIKRIIGLPNETVELRGERVIVRDESGEMLLEEPYLAVGNDTSEFLTRRLSPSEYFVLGDNRRASSDSRVWGPVPAELIVGRAFLRLLPITEFELLPGAAEL